MDSVSCIDTRAEEEKKLENPINSTWISQATFRLEDSFVVSLRKIENSPLVIQEKLISCTEGREITQNKNGCKILFYVRVNLLERSAEVKLGNDVAETVC